MGRFGAGVLVMFIVYVCLIFPVILSITAYLEA